MYYSYQLYTENTGLSYCILGMCNLTGYVHVPVKYESFWKIISIKNAILKFVLLVSTFWHLCDEPVLILLVGMRSRLEWS